MASKRRPSPSEEEIRRIAEAIDSLDTFEDIQDYSSFVEAYEDYLGDDNNLTSNDYVKNQVFAELQQSDPDRIDKEDIFRLAGGKDLRKDRRFTSKTIVLTKEEYIKKGSSKTDLKGYDTKKKLRKKRDFNVVGKVRGKVVYASREYVMLKGKMMLRYRDRRGRFISVRK